MSDFKYPGYTPMTDDERKIITAKLYAEYKSELCAMDIVEYVEQAVLARLKPDAWCLRARQQLEAEYVSLIRIKRQYERDTTESEALVARIDSEWLTEHIPADLESLLRDIRAYLVGGA